MKQLEKRLQDFETGMLARLFGRSETFREKIIRWFCTAIILVAVVGYAYAMQRLN